MKKLIVIYAIALTACANEISVPDTVTVTGEPTLTVRHEVVISLEMQDLFKDQCAADNPGADQATLDDCYNKKATEFINKFLNLLNQQQETPPK